eukprot:7919367-Pyramimonas_sp.AAC.2
MVALHVDLELALQTVVLQEVIRGGHVPVVLVLTRLLRLGLEQQRAVEPDPSLPIKGGERPRVTEGETRQGKVRSSVVRLVSLGTETIK